MTKVKCTAWNSLRIELSRGLRERRFWMVVALLFLVYVVLVALRSVWPLTLYYNGGGLQAIEAQGNRGFSPSTISYEILDLYLFMVYFPLIAAIAYGHSILDDRKNGYMQQSVMRQGMRSYIFSKLCAGSILGGLMGILQIVSVYVITLVGIQFNPLVQEALQCYLSLEEGKEYGRILFWEDTVVADHLTLLQYLGIGVVSMFLMGALFGLLAGIIGMCTENQLMVYMLPVVLMQIWDISVSLCVSLISDKLPVLASLIGKSYFKSSLGYYAYGDLQVPVKALIGVLLMSCVAVLLFPYWRKRYSGEVTGR